MDDVNQLVKHAHRKKAPEPQAGVEDFTFVDRFEDQILLSLAGVVGLISKGKKLDESFPGEVFLRAVLDQNLGQVRLEGFVDNIVYDWPGGCRRNRSAS